eukprot:TRINITY_DN1571_c0_g1_i19.p1 TRINITY_DN1571_c0_g1~~TRINITY_DN1571_c0_g1_i19.p1  ORF type:complete len:145 (-),score=43.98 TRINITY_DN1571_c0_g1_i19:357-791(-)
MAWNGRALQHASEELRADREVVLAAVQQDGWALQHASEELRADREFMLWNGGPGGHHMKAQQTSQHMQDTARRALDTYSELMVEHPFQTLKWVESCVESLASEELRADREVHAGGGAVSAGGGAAEWQGWLGTAARLGGAEGGS